MNEKTVTRIMMILNPEEEDEEHTSRNEGQVVKTLVEVGGLLIIFLLMQTGHVMIAKIMTLISVVALIVAMAIWHILRENNPRTKNGETTTRKMLYSPSLRELCKLADDGASDHEIKESAYFLSLQHELIRILRDNEKKVKRNLDRSQIGLTAPLR